MTDKDDMRIEEFFKQAARQQIDDDGFTERVMSSLPRSRAVQARRLSRLWTLFCILLAAVIFYFAGGIQLLEASLLGLARMLLNAFEVLVLTATTAEVPVNPWTALLMLAFVLVYLPYQTGRKLSSVL